MRRKSFRKVAAVILSAALVLPSAVQAEAVGAAQVEVLSDGFDTGAEETGMEAVSGTVPETGETSAEEIEVFTDEETEESAGAGSESCGKNRSMEVFSDGTNAVSVADVQAQINALPTLDETAFMSGEMLAEAYEQVQSTYDVYMALTEEQKAEITGAEVFESLFTVFNEGTILAADTGNFQIEGGVANTDYTYADGVLTVNDGANIIISMVSGATTPTSDRIVIAENATATVTLVGVNINPGGAGTKDGYSGIDLSSGSRLNLMLQDNTTNEIYGGTSTTEIPAPGIYVPETATLVVQGKGNLSSVGGNATNTYGANGIGGKPTDGSTIGENCGTVIILSTGNVTISGGSSLIPNSAGTDIGGGKGLTDGDDGQGIKPTGDGKLTVYGNLQVGFSFTIPEGTTLVIPEGSSLTILEGGSLTNNGTIENNGSLTVKGEFKGNSPTGNGETEGVPNPLDYLYYKDGAFQTGSVENYNLITEDSAPALWNLGWYVVKDNVTISERITVNGNIRLLLLDGCTLTAPQGIAVEGSNSLSIYAQSDGDGMGALVADGWIGNAAIGSSVTTGTTSVTCGNITIHGGNIKANTASKSDGAAIGGGQGAASGTVTIYGGVVEATSNDTSSGIGGGSGAASGTFSTGTNGTAVIHASSIADNDDKSGWSGIIFEGTSGQVYGDQTLSDDLTIPTDLTIPEGTTLTIPANTTLTVPEGMTLTNNGTITGEGTLTGDGTLQGAGTVTGVTNTFASNITASHNQNNLQYGDVLTITGSVKSQPPQTNSLDGLDTANQVTLFKDDTQLTEPVTISADGSFTIEYHTSQKGIDIGENTLTVKYGGGNLPEASTTVTVTLTPKPVTGTAENITKVYDGEKNIEFPLTIAASDLVNSTDQVTATATGSFSQKDAGNDLDINDITVTAAGSDAKWYTVSAPEGLKGSITPSDSHLNVSVAQRGQYTYGETIKIDLRPTPTAFNALNTEPNRAELLYNGQVLATATVGDDGVYRLSYQTTDKKLPIGPNGVSISFGGDGNLNGREQSVTLTLSAKTVEAQAAGAVTKPYDDNTSATIALTVNGLVDGDNFTGTVSGTYDSKNVGTDKTVNVSGTPEWTDKNTASWYQITVPATFTGSITKAEQEAPASGKGYGIDYHGETATAQTGYELADSKDAATGTATLTVTPGTSIYVRAAETDTHQSSGWTEVKLPARPEKPEGIEAVAEQFQGEKGKITGVTPEMEYKATGDEKWTECEENEVTLSAGTYQVRIAATENSFASQPVDVEIKAGVKRTYTLNITAPIFDSVREGYGKQDAKALTITSIGNSDTTVTGVSLSGEGAEAFTLNKTNGTTISAGQTDNTTYTIQPKTGLSADTYTATVIVSYHDGETVSAEVSFKVLRQWEPSRPTDGLHPDSNGDLWYYKDGRIDKTFEGMVTYDGSQFYVKDGKVQKIDGLKLVNETWYFLTEGRLQIQHTGLVQYDGEWFYVTKGILDTTISGVVPYDGGEFVFTQGRLIQELNGLWLNPGDHTWYFIANGQVQRNYTGLALYDGHWFHVVNGIFDQTYTGLVIYNNAWFYVTKGELNTGISGVVSYNGGKFIFSVGRLANEVNGLWLNPKDKKWYFASNGQIQTQYTGVAMYDNEWFYIRKGMLASDYNGTIQYNGATFRVQAGQLYEQIR